MPQDYKRSPERPTKIFVSFRQAFFFWNPRGLSTMVRRRARPANKP
jgi:hypothetical protein